MANYGGIVNGSIKNKKGRFNTIFTDAIITNNEIINTLTVTGTLLGNGKTTFTDDIYMKGNVYIQNETLQNMLNIQETSYYIGDVLLNGTNQLIGNTYLQNNLFLDTSGIQYLYGCNKSRLGGLGINNRDPQSTIDIRGNITQSFNVFTSEQENRNTIAQNNTFKGIVVNTTDTSSNIFFYNDSTIPSLTNYSAINGDAAISFIKGNTLQISNNKSQIFIRPDVTSLSKRGYRSDISGATTLIYDISYGLYNPNIYGNSLVPTTSTTGKALWLVSNDNSSNTFTIIGAPNKIGAALGGGPYPFDTSRGMNTIGLSDQSGNYNSAINIISGKDNLKYSSTIGINTFKPRTEKYVLDINGPIHIDNGDMKLINTTTNTLVGMKSDKYGYSYLYGVQTIIDNSRNNIISVYNNNENTWKYLNITLSTGSTSTAESINQNSYYINSLYAIDCSHIFVGMSNLSEIRYTIDGILFKITTLNNNNNNYKFNQIYANKNIDNSYNLYLCETTNLHFSILDPVNNDLKYKKSSSFTSSINSIFGINNTIYIATQTDISINIFDTTTSTISGRQMIWPQGNPSSSSYSSIYAIDTSNIIAVGTNIISYTNDGLNWNYTRPAAIFNNVYLYNSTTAISYDSSNNFWLTQNGLNNWAPMSSNFINSSGKSNILYTNNSFIGFTNPSPSTLLVAANNSLNNQFLNGQIIYCFVPNIFNRKFNNILDVCGNMAISGDIHIDDYGEIISNNDTFRIVNQNVDNILLGGDSRQLIIGNAISGNTYIRHNIDISLNTTIHGITYMVNGTPSTGINNGTLIITGGAGISGNAFIGGNLNVTRDASFNVNLNIAGNIIQNTSINNGFIIQF
jgi:hypothetical protein